MKLSAALSFLFVASASAFAPTSTSRSAVTSSQLYQTKVNRNQNPFGNAESIQFDEASGDTATSGSGRLADKLNEADIERRKIAEEADRRERAAEIRREERLAKIAYMRDMPDSQPAGTVDEFMFKEGVQDQLDKLDRDLVGRHAGQG